VYGTLWRRGQRQLLIGAILLSMMALFFSSSKTMWIAFFITLLLFSFLKKSRVGLVWAAVLVGFMLVGIFIKPQVRKMGAHVVNFAYVLNMQECYLG